MFEIPKVPYEPNQEKRFRISDDEYSKERVWKIELFYKKMRDFFEVSMGLVLFGSLAKGKVLDMETKENADVDLTLFIDVDEYNEKYVENLKKSDTFLFFEKGRLNTYAESHRGKLLIETLDKIKREEEISSDENDIIHRELDIHKRNQFLYLFTIWHGYTDNEEMDVAKSSFSFRGKQSSDVERINHLQNIHDIQVLPIQKNGEFSILAQAELVKERMLQWNLHGTEIGLDIKKQDCMCIARMFGLDVGGGMKKYRQAFIKELVEMGVKGETLWMVVDRAIRLCERDNDIPNVLERQFPETLEKAVKYYSAK